MLRVRAIQVEHGDGILVSYGDPMKPRHLLVDAGPSKTFPTVLEVLDQARVDGRLRLEALVISHYDLDHIKGVIELLANIPPWLEIADVWFNGRNHARPSDTLGSKDADELTKLIFGAGLPWNAEFRRDAKQEVGEAVVQTRKQFTLAGGLQVSVLSPDVASLAALGAQWPEPSVPPGDTPRSPGDRLGRKDKWPPEPFSKSRAQNWEPDRSAPNRSSIALLLTLDDRRVLLAADACADVVLAGLDLHLPGQERVDLLKVSHHGSSGNTDVALIERLGCRAFLISTSGLIHKHPDNALLERLLAVVTAPEIIFNYREGWPGNWKKRPAGWPSYRAKYPEIGDRFVDVVL